MLSGKIPKIIYKHIIIEKISKNVYKNFFLEFKITKNKKAEIDKNINKEFKQFDISNYIKFLEKELEIIKIINLTKKESKNLLRCCKYNLEKTCYEHDEELKDLVHSYFINKAIAKISKILTYGNWFVKFNTRRLDEIKYREEIQANPIKLAYEVLDRILETNTGMNFLKYNNFLEYSDTKIYIKKFNPEINLNDEFRIFVYKRNITTISSKFNILTKCNNLDDCNILDECSIKYGCLNTYELHYIAENIVKYVKKIVKKLPNEFQNFAVDIYYTHQKIIFINLKPLGLIFNIVPYLFSWKNDIDKIYSNGNYIYFRIIS